MYASELSCGSTRAAPLTPAIRISLQGIYLNDDGVLAGVKKPLPHQYEDDILAKKRSAGIMGDILVEFDELHAENHDLKAELRSTAAELRAKIEQHHGAAEKRGHHIIIDVVISAVAVLACAALVVFLRKKRTTISS